MEEILKKIENKQAEVLNHSERKERELTPEKQKEILKEAVNERITENISITPTVQQNAQNVAVKLKDESKERQIELLVQMAFDKSVIEAVEIAKNLDNPYLLDEFHDTLVDRLYSKLVAEGKLKQI